MPSKDRTALHCENCGVQYGLNEARVIRALKTAKKRHQGAAKLCWVCAHLFNSLRDEAPENVIRPEDCL